jgi:hypothetical protein
MRVCSSTSPRTPTDEIVHPRSTWRIPSAASWTLPLLALSVGVILSTSPNHEVYEVMTLVTPVWRRAASSRGGQSEIKLGVIPGIGGSQRLTRAIGKAKAMDLCLTDRTLSADEADA